MGLVNCKIIKNREIKKDIYELIFENNLLEDIRPGQFVNLYCKSKSNLLPRPISICEVNKEEKWIKLVYGVVGQGTKIISKYKEGEIIEVLGPLGNGFNIINAQETIIVGGGLGTPPLLELAKNIKGKKTIFLGFRTNPYLIEELEKYGQVFVATDDGSVGDKGTVIELLDKHKAKGQILYACGPVPMLKALKDWVESKGIQGQFSLEERMGCGFGACVGCVCKIKVENENGFTYKKVCKDGPIFDAREVVFNESRD